MFSLLFALVLCEHTFKVEGDNFMMDGKPFRYISGEYHYFRQHPNEWENNIKKMANGGLNAIQIYVAWNLHEPVKGNFNFEGIADIERFIELAAKYNMYILLRPGPFICAEWDFGGFPAWLGKNQNIRVRSQDPEFLKHVDDWFKVLYGKLQKHLFLNGGNIISVQIENEYASYYECDHVYLNHLCDLAQKYLHKDIFLFTVDSYQYQSLECGAIPNRAYVTLDFGVTGDPAAAKKKMQDYNHGGPPVNTEFYTGWIDHWGEQHHTVDPVQVCEMLDKMLNMNYSVSFYMYYGGTNWGFWAGANGDRWVYDADPTSYDYDAPLSEAGDMTYKYQRIRDVIKRHVTWEIPSHPVQNTTKKTYGKVKFTKGCTLSNAIPFIGTPQEHSSEPKSFEELGSYYGFVNYRTETSGGNLKIPKIHDHAVIMVNDEIIADIDREDEKAVEIPKGKLDILVQNMGRINAAFLMVEEKGLPEGVKLYNVPITGWENIGLPLNNLDKLKFTSGIPKKGPAFYYAEFEISEIGDTFLKMSGFTRGVAFINGHNIGRYWNIGPPVTMFVSQHLLVKGYNEVIIFELTAIPEDGSVEFIDYPILDIPLSERKPKHN